LCFLIAKNREKIKKKLGLDKFYEPDCMGCEDFESTWKDLAKSFKSKRSVCFAELNCEDAKVICNEYELRYEPNLI